MFKGVLLESSSSGDGHAVPGSPEAVKRLFAAGLPVRFLTNESQCTRRLLWEKLNRLGYSLPGDKDQDNFCLPHIVATRTGIVRYPVTGI
jgi:ribonucleotide monophosphatase NagD (HAD superfamily)